MPVINDKPKASFCAPFKRLFFELKPQSWMDPQTEELVTSVRVVPAENRDTKDEILRRAREKIIPVLEQAPSKGLSQTAIVKKTGLHHDTVGKYLDALLQVDEIESHDNGNWIGYTLKRTAGGIEE